MITRRLAPLPLRGRTSCPGPAPRSGPPSARASTRSTKASSPSPRQMPSTPSSWTISGKKVGCGPPNTEKHAGQLGLEPPVHVQVVALRAGDDRVGRHVGLELAGHRHRVVVGGHGQLHLVARCLEGAGQVHDALGLVIDLLSDKQHAQDHIHLRKLESLPPRRSDPATRTQSTTGQLP